MKTLLIFFFSSLITVALAHLVAIHFYLYWTYRWIDNPIHALGGVTVALGVSILPFLGVTILEKFPPFWTTFLCVLFVGVVWEIFEITTGIMVFEPGYVTDTVSDLLMDCIGGVIGYYVVQSVKKI